MQLLRQRAASSYRALAGLIPHRPSTHRSAPPAPCDFVAQAPLPRQRFGGPHLLTAENNLPDQASVSDLSESIQSSALGFPITQSACCFMDATLPWRNARAYRFGCSRIHSSLCSASSVVVSDLRQELRRLIQRLWARL